MNTLTMVVSRASAGLLLVAMLVTAPRVFAETYYFHTDNLGTPQAVTNESGSIVWEGHYDPFGSATETVATIEQNLRFPGQYLDRETGLHQNWHRDYDPTIGRYIQSDPIGLAGGLNTYGYVSGNPLSRSDPFGLVELTVTSAFRKAAARGDVEELEMLFDLIHNNLSPDQKSLLREQCANNFEKRKAGTLDVRAEEKRLYEASRNSEQASKAAPRPVTKTNVIAELFRAIVKLF